jgi:hypothetical protein
MFTCIYVTLEDGPWAEVHQAMYKTKLYRSAFIFMVCHAHRLTKLLKQYYKGQTDHCCMEKQNRNPYNTC